MKRIVAIRLTDEQFIAIGQSYLRELQDTLAALPVVPGRERAANDDRNVIKRAIELSEEIDQWV